MILTMVSAAILMSPAYSAPVANPPYAVQLRKNVASLTATEIQGLRDAVAAMKALPASDPRSWTAQAEIHNDFCPHGNNHFLPWHRKYLYYFEKILVSMSGGKLKALPYWDYTNPAQAKLPSIFVNPTYGGGTANPLYHSNRSATYAPGVNPLPPALMDPTNALNDLAFNGFSSKLEGTPHNRVHTEISGTMGGFRSPLDPIFWLHHCNIDRLWERWRGMGGGRANPIDAAWLNANWNSTTFYDQNANPHQLKNSDVLNTVAQLNYRYTVIIFPPFRDFYYWRRLFRWEILQPIPFDFVRGPFKTQIARGSDDQVRQLARLARIDPKMLSATLNFEVEGGNSTNGSLDLIATAGRGTQGVKITSFALFGLRHKGGADNMHGMREGEAPMTSISLTPAETARLIKVMRSKDFSFTVQASKGSANNAKIAQDSRIRMSLKSIDFSQSTRVKR